MFLTYTEEQSNLRDELRAYFPGLFQGPVIGTQAYLPKVNSSSGIFPRQLKPTVGDGQLACDENHKQRPALIPNVFAFVGSFSLYDECGADELKAAPAVPDIHNAWAATRWPTPARRRNGPA